MVVPEHDRCEVDFPEDRVLNVTPRRLLDFLEQRTGKHIAELADF
ncbi:putative hydrolase YcdX [Pantoea sp. AS-PWVM4]|nr:putative hydrolase YcdX [Pantoea sp. AS-PWVM4]